MDSEGDKVLYNASCNDDNDDNSNGDNENNLLKNCCDVKRLWIFYIGSSLLITLTLVLIG